VPKRYRIDEEHIAEIRNARKQNKDEHVKRRLYVLLLHAQKKHHDEIAIKTGYVKSYVSELVSKYCSRGISVITGNHYTGNHRNLSFAEEEGLLEPFRQKAESGQIVDIREITLAYEAVTGKSLNNNHGQIYRVLHRHGWQKTAAGSKRPSQSSSQERATAQSTELAWMLNTR